MSSETQLDGVQQQIADVGRAVSNLEASLAGAERAGDDRKVEFLRDRLKALDKKEVALREKENLLLRAQQNGGTRSDADVARMRKLLQETAFINQWHEQQKGWPWVLVW
ncbi:TPA: hypothetical protein ACH3X3_002882 [Trebouxia sp. C0006]